MYSQLIQEIKRRILEDYNTGDEEYDAIAQGALASLLAYAEDQQKMPKDLRKESQEYLKTLSESPYNTPVANYAGDPLLFPDRDQILEMVDAMRDSAPVAYTLDVGVLEKTSLPWSSATVSSPAACTGSATPRSFRTCSRRPGSKSKT